MTVLYKNAKQICQTLSKTVNEMHNGLTFLAIPHHDGQRNDALTIEATNFSGHKAEQFMRRIISNQRLKSDETTYLGAAIAFEQGFLGLYYKALRISILTVNIDQYDDLNDMKADLYHHLWLALDKDNEIKKVEHGGQHEHHKYPIKSDKMALTRRNLKADIFSVLMQSFENIPDAPLTLGRARALQAIKAEPSHKALYYVYPLAMEACQFLLNDLVRQPINQQSQISIALKLTEEISLNVSDESIQSWWEFAEPAATMAWLDYTEQEILSACVNSGLDPLIRANGILLQEILDIELLSPKELVTIYNSFGDKDNIKELHEEQSDSSFEEALIQGIKTASNRPFLDEALFQNERLSQGKALGWTASALQASAKAFDKALKSGRTPEQAARLEYEGVKSHSDWESLEELSHKILEARQDGATTTLESIVDLYGENQDYRNILESFEKTLSDPAYSNKLARDPAPQGPAIEPDAPGPKTPTPSLELSASPKQAAAPSGPLSAPAGMGIGGGGMGTAPPLRASKPLGQNTSSTEKEDGKIALDDDA